MILVNGQQTDAIPVSDRGLQYGDGLFETIAISQGQPLQWQAHLQRLQKGCARLGISMPDEDALIAETRKLANDCERGVLKIIVTRGSGGRGYRPARNDEPTRILSLHPCPDYPAAFTQEGISLRLCETRLGRQPRLAGLKHLNRLEQVLARQEWDDEQIPEGLMLDSEGLVIEGTQTNLFIEKDGALLTPRLDQCGVEGIMRQTIISLCERQGIDCQETQLDLDDLKGADALFVCNSVIGLWPVNDFNGRSFPISPLLTTLRDDVSKFFDV